MSTPGPIIIVDKQEKTPFEFANLPTETAHLDTGDYSIKGLEHRITVERKSLADLLGCIGGDRDRFKRELQRMLGYRFRLLVIETTAAELEAGEWRSKLTPATVMGNLAAWTGQYELPIWLSGSHDAGARFVERFLFQAARRVAMENSASAPCLTPVAVAS